MTITARWFDRLPNWKADYDKKHFKEFSSDSAKDCFRQFQDYFYNHDVVKFTIPEIVNMED